MPVSVREGSEDIDEPQNMNSEMFRFVTFESFPSNNKPFGTRLAQAGFYYTSLGDKVQCYSCKKIFCNWSANDNPLEVHRNYSPTCRFLTNNRDVNIAVTTVPDDHLSVDMSGSLDSLASFDDQSSSQREAGRLEGAVCSSDTFEANHQKRIKESSGNMTRATTQITKQSLPSAVSSVQYIVQDRFVGGYKPVQTVIPSSLQPPTNGAFEVNVSRNVSEDVVNATPLLPSCKSVN